MEEVSLSIYPDRELNTGEIVQFIGFADEECKEELWKKKESIRADYLFDNNTKEWVEQDGTTNRIKKRRDIY